MNKNTIINCEWSNADLECTLWNKFIPEGNWSKCVDLKDCPNNIDRNKELSIPVSKEKTMINEIKIQGNARTIKLSDWEIDFIKSVDKRTYWSLKQKEIIEKIYKRCEDGN